MAADTNEHCAGPLEAQSPFLSWGRYPRVRQYVKSIAWRDEDVFSLPEACSSASLLPQGLARSYGDSCLNAQNVLLSTRGLNRILSFNRTTGTLRCEAGVSLKDILPVIVPAGWFLPVSPGTQFVTIGGAIANDIHGKNHHREGSFGRHVLRFRLLRSTGGTVECSATNNASLFAATVGGLGLTGLILDAEIQLIPVSSPYIEVDEIQFRSLQEFRQLSAESAQSHQYSVAWIDCVSSGKNFARGVLIRGNHLEKDRVPASLSLSPAPRKALACVPFDAPPWMLGKSSVQLFNGLYFHKQVSPKRTFISHFAPFFYPLDSIRNWNRIYGSRGFFQFQCVVPQSHSLSADPLDMVLNQVVRSGHASFLAVLKEFGDSTSPGMLSFPRPGTTLCLDFANRGPETVALYHRLEELVRDFGGAIYPAKDALMRPSSFKSFFPRLGEFSSSIDPRFSSSFWRRVTAEETSPSQGRE